MTGGNGGVSTDTDYVTIAYNAATGARIWLKRYDGPAGLDDAGISLAVNRAGTAVFVTGTSWSAQSAYDVATIAYRVSDGRQLWLKRYNGPGNGDDTGLSVAVSPAGTTVYVTGHSAGRTSGADCTTIAYNSATGTQRWVMRYNGAANRDDAGYAVAVSPNGKVIYVTGTSSARGADFDYVTIAYSAATRARIWLRSYNGPAKAADSAVAVRVSPRGGRVFVTGHSQGPGAGPDYATVAYRG